MQRLETRKQRVLRALRAARNWDRAADGWVDGPYLCSPLIGGSEGLRRLRELRADGYVIEMRRSVNGVASRFYRIVE